MTTATLFAQLRTQLAGARGVGLTGVRALEGAMLTVDALEDAVRLAEQLGATRVAARYGEMLRHLSGGSSGADIWRVPNKAGCCAKATRPSRRVCPLLFSCSVEEGSIPA